MYRLYFHYIPKLVIYVENLIQFYRLIQYVFISVLDEADISLLKTYVSIFYFFYFRK